jgi:hypothetical protein
MDVTAFLPFAPRVSVATEDIERQTILTDILQIGAAGAIDLICNRRASVCVRKPDFALFSGRLRRYSEVLIFCTARANYAAGTCPQLSEQRKPRRLLLDQRRFRCNDGWASPNDHRHSSSSSSESGESK